ncbi:MAG TPA: DUF2071 domain-containing protein [Phycisphaerales bacterium]|nr:DUF2071 domain-containing protein [Phycisphaerales bacterium]
MARPFLTARWQDLVIITWPVPEELLRARLPEGLELDRWQGRACVSLVAFDFRDCRVKGIAFPGLVNFPEVNLRFYVREAASGRRGVVFIREFVPSHVISLVARVVYNEPYRAVRMRSSVEFSGGRVKVEHALSLRPTPLRITAGASADTWVPPDDTAEHFFKEHSWGYGKNRRGRALVYEVRHPVWSIRRAVSVSIDGDLGQVYGPEWAFLNTEPPLNVLLAVGSAVEVFGHAGL